MTESTSAVEQAIQQRIAAAKIRAAAAKERRGSLAEARRVGLARRHAQKLRRLAAQQRLETEQRQDDEQPRGGHRDTAPAPTEGRRPANRCGPPRRRWPVRGAARR